MQLSQMGFAIKDGLSCTVSVKKAAVVASHESLVKSIRGSIGDLGGGEVDFAANLGVDNGAAKKRGRKRKGTIRGQRLWKGAARKRKSSCLEVWWGPALLAMSSLGAYCQTSHMKQT